LVTADLQFHVVEINAMRGYNQPTFEGRRSHLSLLIFHFSVSIFSPSARKNEMENDKWKMSNVK